MDLSKNCNAHYSPDGFKLVIKEYYWLKKFIKLTSLFTDKDILYENYFIKVCEKTTKIKYEGILRFSKLLNDEQESPYVRYTFIK